MENTPRSERIHIGIYGRRNSGKSSLLNALTGQQAAIVSEIAGTTTDPVHKNMEFPGLGAVVITDTAGFDDEGSLGAERIEQTRRAAESTDIAVVVCGDGSVGQEVAWIEMFRERGTPVVIVLNKSDMLPDPEAALRSLERQLGVLPLMVSSTTGAGIKELKAAIAKAGAALAGETSITGDLVAAGDVVLLVMPQDEQAPRGRLILPEVQTLRELLDKGCISVSCTPELMPQALKSLASPPRLVITDSQAFGEVAALTPAESLLTSFSVLFAAYKGDVGLFVEGASALTHLTQRSRVLIAEACTHAPANEDIGRVKLPRMLRKRFGEGLLIDIVSGADFPQDLTSYDLVIHCGACMFNRRHVLSRVARAASAGVPVTNYGIAIAALAGILDKVAYPGGR